MRPANVNDYIEFSHDTDLGEVICWLYFEPEERETDSPMVFELRHAWFGDLDIAKHLKPRVVKQIENNAYIEFMEGETV